MPESASQARSDRPGPVQERERRAEQPVNLAILKRPGADFMACETDCVRNKGSCLFILVVLAQLAEAFEAAVARAGFFCLFALGHAHQLYDR